MAGSSSKPQVFINFRGSDDLNLRHGFLSFLKSALEDHNINVYTDESEHRGRPLTYLFKRIEESRIALAIFSNGYSESKWCLDELAKIIECMNEGKLKVIPIFYKIETAPVKELTGKFGDAFRRLKREYKEKEPERVQKWKEALQIIPVHFALLLRENSGTSERDFVEEIVKRVKELLVDISYGEKTNEVNTDWFTICADKLEIEHINNPQCWTWTTPTQEGIAIAKLLEVYWFHITGKFCTKKLIPGTPYEAVFLVKLDDTASGWRKPVNLEMKLLMDDESEFGVNKQTLSLNNYRGDDWVDVKAGDFVVLPRETPADIIFTICQYVDTDKKTGFEIKGVAIRPKIDCQHFHGIKGDLNDL